MFDSHLYVFFEEMSTQVFFPFFNWVVFLVLSCMSCLYILESNPLSVVSFAIIFSHYEDCLFTLLIVFSAVQKLLNLIRFHLFTFISISITLGVVSSSAINAKKEKNRMGKTRDLFKKIRDTKGTFHAKWAR